MWEPDTYVSCESRKTPGTDGPRWLSLRFETAQLVDSEMAPKKDLPRARAERDPLAEFYDEWAASLYTIFEDNASLHLFMELFPGRDRDDIYQIFSEGVTRFYAAQIMLTIEV